MPINVMENPDNYMEFYQMRGKGYKETEKVHGSSPVRYNATLREILPFARKGSLMLDVTCNNGVFSIPYCQLGGYAHGIDIDEEAIKEAREKAGDLPVSFEVANAEEYIAEDEFDFALMAECLEHFRNPHVVVRNVVKSLKRGGHLLLTTPSALYTGVRTSRYIKQLLVGKKLLQEHTIIAEDTELGKYGIEGEYRHDGYYPLALKRWLENFDLECERFYTVDHGDKDILATTLRRLQDKVKIDKISFLNLFGATNFQLLRKV